MGRGEDIDIQMAEMDIEDEENAELMFDGDVEEETNKYEFMFGWAFPPPNSLVSHVYKARYFPDSHILRAVQGVGSSFIWSGIWTAKEKLFQGYWWVVGDGDSINAAKDPWRRDQMNFCVNQSHNHPVENVPVSSLFMPTSKQWDKCRVREQLQEDDARTILATHIPQNTVKDRVAWVRTTTGHYSLKTGYQLWHEQNIRTFNVPQNGGWSKIWRLSLPHKVKILMWSFVGIIFLSVSDLARKEWYSLSPVLYVKGMWNTCYTSFSIASLPSRAGSIQELYMTCNKLNLHQWLIEKLYNQFEVGHVLDSCRVNLQSTTGISVSFVKKQANKVAREMARIPCLLNCQNVFTSPPTSLLETFFYDILT